MSRRQAAVEALLDGGYELAADRGKKDMKFVPPDGDEKHAVHVCINGAIRIGRSRRNSRPCPLSFKQRIFN